jgi:hypothetical protein
LKRIVSPLLVVGQGPPARLRTLEAKAKIQCIFVICAALSSYSIQAEPANEISIDPALLF